jgi:putative secretion ATPase (PEP-CTERM system associated)
MYERFYNLRERPFSLTPDPDYLFLSRVHREGLNHLRYGIEGHAGFVVVTGEIGCGKTTLMQTVLRGLDQQTAISRLVNTALDSRELIEAVMLDFGLTPAHGQSKPFLLRDLARYLVDQRNAGRNVLLVIDEAQNLSEQALEEVRMLSNLETEKSKLIQIVLIGQPNLRDVLARPSLEQFRQRVTVNYHLQPMDREETAAYINHRLRRAAIWIPLTFPTDVTDLIYHHSRGVARKVNIISDAVLLFGYGANKPTIDLQLTQEVLDELGCRDSDGVSSNEEAAVGAAPDLEPEPDDSAIVEPVTPAFMQPSADARQSPAGDLPRQEGIMHAAAPTPKPSMAEKWLPITPPVRQARPLVLPVRPASHGRSPFAPPGHRVLSEHRAHRDGVWRRMWRGLIGSPKPVFED